MPRSDTVAAVLAVAITIFVGWAIWKAVRTGSWRYRGGTAYRDKSPNLFWGIITFATISEVGLVLICLMQLNQVIFCGISVIPKVCIAQTYHRFLQ
jgi:hypothetical protein